MILLRGPGGDWVEDRNLDPEFTYCEQSNEINIERVQKRSEDWYAACSDWRNNGCVLRDATSVRFRFDTFGYNESKGGQRYTRFAVDVEWADVLIAIKRFAEHGEPTAKFLQAGLDALNMAIDPANEKV